MTLSDWIQKNAKVPILKVLGLALGIQILYFCFLIYSRCSGQLDKIDVLKESMSVGVQQSNRPLIESTILSALSNPDIVAVVLCSGPVTRMSYPPSSKDYCGNPKTSITTWVVKRRIIGIQDLDLAVVLSPISFLTPLLFWICISCVMTGAILWLLMRVQKRFVAEILAPISVGLIADVPLIVKELEELRLKNMERTKMEKEKARMEAFVNLSTQVAHDIRSPLAALGAAAKGLEMPEDQRKLVEGAVSRMQGIADDLLHRYRAPSAAPTAAKPEVCALGGFIEQVLSEKRLQHKDKTGFKIEFNGTTGEIKALVEPKELQRLLSNLVNNSLEAFAGPGTIVVSLSALDGKALIEVKDNGKGIPPEILAKLGQKGETHGKTGGTGLGLYHARTTVEGWGGSFKIGSEPGKGTTVLIELPRPAAPAARIVVLLDDDMLVHMNWKLAAKAAGVELKAYKSGEDFAAGAEALPKGTPLYIDSDLGNDLKGEDIAKELHEKGFTDITMATGHGSEKFSHLPWLKVTGKEPPF